jgi:hypothetical protein
MRAVPHELHVSVRSDAKMFQGRAWPTVALEWPGSWSIDRDVPRLNERVRVDRCVGPDER